ncbi:MAG: UvrD-helicase domain-containing protein [Kiritimatiellae bacterium]|nr:UvrD-helicase domain-containing protein [Kiritimatiellia bacterium]
MIDYAELLNAEQCEAATAKDGPLLVLAAAGTGKTRTLVYRVAYLMERGVDPENILLLTFTNRAANEMIERARAIAGGNVGALWSGTFHHICNRFLRRFCHKLGYKPWFRILDQDDSRTLIDSCIKECVKDVKEFPKKDVVGGWISEAANSEAEIEEVVEAAAALPVDLRGEAVEVVKLYIQRKREMEVMDFDDLLVNGLRLLTECADVRALYQQQFQHVLVDEYQDTNRLQAKIVDILAAGYKNVMAVGDDFQCIYSWRGADFKNIMNFPNRWPGCAIVKLEQNYRSVPEILSVANESIKGNPDQFQKTLRPTRASKNKPQVFFLRDGNEQAGGVLSMIHRYQDDGYKLRDMVVLYRAHFHSIELQLTLGRNGIPYSITSGISVFEQAHIKDVLALLQLIVNQRDFIAFTRLLCLLSGVGTKTSERLWEKLGHSFQLGDPVQRATLMKNLRPAALRQWAPIDAFLTQIYDQGLAEQGRAAIEGFCDAFYTEYLNLTYENADKRGEDIEELTVQIASAPKLEDFLQEVALLTNVDHQFDKNARSSEDKIHLSTIHQAKGLEWPVVFVIWVVEGMFPSARAIGDCEDDREERRLFYVAVTRAQNELVLMSPRMRRLYDGGVMPCDVSRFIKEIRPELMRTRHGMPYY